MRTGLVINYALSQKAIKSEKNCIYYPFNAIKVKKLAHIIALAP
jgi:hypothetical protein